MTKYADRGKWAEGEADTWLKATAAARVRFAYHRYPDARAARGALAAQPCDYLVADGDSGFKIHLEVKETANERRLPRDKVSQYGKLKMFWWAGIQPRILVYRSEQRDWVWFGPKLLFATDDAPTSWPLTDLPRYPTAAEALRDIFFPVKEDL